jgi:hypothetical protein
MEDPNPQTVVDRLIGHALALLWLSPWLLVIAVVAAYA